MKGIHQNPLSHTVDPDDGNICGVLKLFFLPHLSDASYANETAIIPVRMVAGDLTATGHNGNIFRLNYKKNKSNPPIKQKTIGEFFRNMDTHWASAAKS